MRSSITYTRFLLGRLSLVPLALMVVACAGAGETRTDEPVVGDGPYEARFAEARTQGADGVRSMAPLLADPDGVAQRGAMRTVREIAYQSTRQGAEAERRAVSMTILSLVQEPSAIPLEMRRLLVRMLAVPAGDERSMAALSALRGDVQLGADAEYALQVAMAEPAGAEKFPGRQIPAQDALLASLAAREKGTVDASLIHDYRELLTSPQPQMRAAALRALRRLGAKDLYASYLDCLSNADPSLRWIGIAGLADLEEAGTSARLTADWETANPDVRAMMLHALARRGDEESRRLILLTAVSGALRLRLIALELLGAQGDPDALAVLLGTLTDSDAEVVAAAASALTARARRELRKPKEERDEAKARSWLHAVIGASMADAVLNAALDVLADCAAPDSLTLARPLMSRGKTAEAAAAVCLAAAQDLEDESASKTLLLEILDHSRLRSTRKAVGKALVELGVSLSDAAARNGFVTHWFLLGGFPKPTKGDLGKHPFGRQGPDPSRDFVYKGKTLSWKEHVNDDPDAIVDLTILEPNTDVAAYAFAIVDRSTAQDILCKAGSDDSVAIWINGGLVHENNAARGVSVDEDEAPARLVAGKNRILVKIGQGGGGWAFCLRLTDSKGHPLDLRNP